MTIRLIEQVFANKKSRTRAECGFQEPTGLGGDQPADGRNALTRRDNREIFLDAVFRCKTPLLTLLRISGSAAAKACRAEP